MSKLLAGFAALTAGMVALTVPTFQAAASFVDEARLEKLGAYCTAGHSLSCEELLKLTGGQCAGPQGSGCRFDAAAYRDQ